MIFDSIEYFILLITVFIVFQIVEIKKTFFILMFSLIFYSFGGATAVAILSLNIILNFFLVQYMASKEFSKRKHILWFIVFINFFILIGSKYFLKNVNANFIVPLGISYFTLQALSYVFDVYYKEIKVENNFLVFATFISFFPQLIIGPIERAEKLLPQIKEKRIFNYNQIIFGLRLILIGLFKKLVLSNRLSLLVDPVFLNPTEFGSGSIMLSVVLFAFQMYFDLSAYTDIAIGSAKVLGFNLSPNFNFPFFSKSIGEFWRRWHISISSWFKDYIFKPFYLLIYKSKLKKYVSKKSLMSLSYVLAISTTFILLGFWHYFSLNFLIVGLIQAFFLTIEFLFKKNFFLQKILRFKYLDWLKVVYPFSVFCLALIFFKPNDINTSLLFLERIFLNFQPGKSLIDLKEFNWVLMTFVLSGAYMSIEFLQYHFNIYKYFEKVNFLFRWLVYISLIFIILFYGQFIDSSQFIYKQF